MGLSKAENVPRNAELRSIVDGLAVSAKLLDVLPGYIFFVLFEWQRLEALQVVIQLITAVCFHRQGPEIFFLPFSVLLKVVIMLKLKLQF